jgi:hypothetical protein
MSQSEPLERLARRINWLDRYRRPLAILLAAIAAPLLIWQITEWLPADWPGAHMAGIAIWVAVIAWYGIETVLGFVLALWETDYSKLTRPPGLPRAEVVRRK